jgi:hypothetical protein
VRYYVCVQAFNGRPEDDCAAVFSSLDKATVFAMRIADDLADENYTGKAPRVILILDDGGNELGRVIG